MTVPTISVVIPTKNRAHIVPRAIETALAQRGVDLEVVVVNDGSTDATLETLQDRFGFNPRVRVVTNATSRGLGGARNRGIKEARGKWLAFLDDDDVWSPVKLREQLNAAGDTHRWAFSASVEVTDNLEVTVSNPVLPVAEFMDTILSVNCVPSGSSNVIAQRQLVIDAGWFDTEVKHFADWDMWCRLALNGPPAICDEYHVGYVIHSTNMSRGASEAIVECDLIEERYHSDRGGSRVRRDLVCSWVARSELEAGRPIEAVRRYLQAAWYGDNRNILRAIVAIVRPERLVRNAAQRERLGRDVSVPQAWLDEIRAPRPSAVAHAS